MAGVGFIFIILYFLQFLVSIGYTIYVLWFKFLSGRKRDFIIPADVGFGDWLGAMFAINLYGWLACPIYLYYVISTWRDKRRERKKNQTR